MKPSAMTPGSKVILPDGRMLERTQAGNFILHGDTDQELILDDGDRIKAAQKRAGLPVTGHLAAATKAALKKR